jgi:photosystem II stability/assembly factor-like uncharacterized protein
VSPKVAWVSGTKGTYGRTTDAGKTWFAGTVPDAEKLDFRDVEAFGETMAYLLSAGPGADSRIYKTVDGGKTWALQFMNTNRQAFYDAMAFWDEKNGIALSDPVNGQFPLIVTADGGANWKRLAAQDLPPALPNEGAFAASGTCLVTFGNNDVWFVTGGAKKARVFHSNNRGQNWTASETPMMAGIDSAGGFSIAFRDQNHGIIVGGDYRKPNETGATAAVTSDGGKNWTLIDKQLPFRSGVAWAKDRWVAVGTSGSHFSQDNGATWKQLDRENYNSVGFIATGEGWAVGPKGRIAKFEPQAESVSRASAHNWDRFRGPNGTGTSDDKEVPLTFGAHENVIWKVALPGAGNCSPVVWGKHLFLQFASNDGTLRSLLCLDTADGKIRWEKSIRAELAKVRADSSLASSTPTTDGKAVYVSFWDGKEILVSAYNFQGDLLWSKGLGSFNSQHGAGASPILFQDKLILANDMDIDDFDTKVPNARPSMLIALDKRTGRMIWETPRKAERACYSAPFLLPKPGQKNPELVVTSTTAVTGYNVETGAKLWEAKGWQEHAIKTPMRTVASPALAGDILCVCSGGDAGRFAIGLDLGDLGKTDLPRRLWENRKDFPYVPSPLARGEHFYFVNDVGFAGCYHARTGKCMWFERLASTGFHASPLIINGNVYATSIVGDVYVFAAEPTFRLLARNELDETVRATAAVVDGRLYIRGERHLYCIGKSR